MKIYHKNISTALKQSNKMKLHSDFKKSLEIISTYPPLVQYIKLSEIEVEFWDRMYFKTKDVKMKENRDESISESISNLKIYAYNGNDNGLKPLVEVLIDSLSRMIIRKKNS